MVVINLQKARKKWSQLTSILGREGSITQVLGTLFKSVIQVVFLFGLDMWVMTTCMGWALGCFKNKVA